MKKVIILLGFFTVSTLSFAMDVQYFMGSEFGSTKYKISYEIISQSPEKESTYKEKYQSLKFGAYIYKYHRINFLSSLYTTRLGSNSIGYDYMISTNTRLTPFIGLEVSRNKYKRKDVKTTVSDKFIKDTIKATYYQTSFNVGTTYDLNDNLALEFGYKKALSANGSDTMHRSSGLNSVEYVYKELDDKFYFGLNYKF